MASYNQNSISNFFQWFDLNLNRTKFSFTSSIRSDFSNWFQEYKIGHNLVKCTYEMIIFLKFKL